ncbi:MAG: hypothetical protein RMK01_03135 [Thermomicrobium sp.]|nr:hypothetical protein [Thermomicrobium sp.]MDW8059046.1 hypothetical protein [Thermomicrobium sp.]
MPRRRFSHWLFAGLALFLAGLVGALVVVLTVPRATVVITPAIEERRLTLTYGPPTATGVDWVAPVRAVQAVVEADAEVPATGEKQVPEGVARGRVRVVNATLEAFTLTAGRQFLGTNGVAYRIVEDTYVPAADPFGSQSFGVADVPVEATVPGPDGNADAGVIAGQLANGILYRNIEPISGGTVRTVRFVTSEDLDRVREAIERELAARVSAALGAALRDGEVLLTGTVRSGVPAIEFAQSVGAEVERVAAHGRLVVEARTYDPEAMHRSAQEEAARRLAQSTTNDVVILGNTLEFGEPVQLDNERWQVEVSAAVRLIPSDTELEQLRNALTGLSVEAATRRVRAVAGVADVAIDLEPAWWPGRLPDRPGRIEVVVRE